MSSDAFIQVRVTPEVKARLQALSEREQITESALVRQLLLTMLRVQVARGLTCPRSHRYQIATSREPLLAKKRIDCFWDTPWLTAAKFRRNGRAQ
jgi:hypothetical protein